MKRKLLLGILSMVMLLPFIVKADEVDILDSVEQNQNSANASVTVGDVAIPTYEVVIIWTDLTFDWVYNSHTKDFEWAPASICSQLGSSKEEVEQELSKGTKIYTDESCTTTTTTYVEDTNHYYMMERETAAIGIEDMSQNGQIVPSITWNSSEKYSDVTAKISYYGEDCVGLYSNIALDYAWERYGKVATDATCKNPVYEKPDFGTTIYYTYAYTLMDLTTEEIPDNGRASGAGFGVPNGHTINGEKNFIGFAPEGNYPRNQYRVSFNLVGGETTPTAGDIIGTITIKIRTAN